MAKAMRVPKFLKRKEKVTTPQVTTLAAAPTTEDITPPHQSEASNVLPKNGHSLYIHENVAFYYKDLGGPLAESEQSCLGDTNESTNDGVARIDFAVIQRKKEEIGSSEDNKNEERSECVEKAVRFVPEDTKADVQQRINDPQPLCTTVKAARSTVPISSSDIVELIDISPRSSLENNSSNNASSKDPVEISPGSPLIDAAIAEQIPSSEQASQISVQDFATNTTSDVGESGISFLGLCESYNRTPTASIKSGPSIEHGSNAHTPRVDRTRNLSNVTTLMGSSSRDVLRLRSSAEFQRQLDDEYQLIAGIQGQQDCRTVERRRVEEEDRALGLDNENMGAEGGKQVALRDQLEEYKNLLLKAKQDGESQAKTYEFLLAKAEQDGKDTLEERQDIYDDTVKHLKKDLDDASNELKEAIKELKAATSKNIVVERRLKKASRERDAVEETNKALADDIALKDGQIQTMSSTLQRHQEELDALSRHYCAARTSAIENAQLVEKNGVTIFNLRQTIDILNGQLAQSAQHKQAPEATLINNLRIENNRLLGIVGENHNLLQEAAVKCASLTQALSQAKREHDRWTSDQFSPMAEDSLSSTLKIANHLAYKDKLYEDLEKRFLAYTAANEEQQKKAREDKYAADKNIDALRKNLEIQTEAVEMAKDDKKKYRREMERIFTTTLGDMPQEAFVEGLSFHFDQVQQDNAALANRVTELEDEVANLKQNVVEYQRAQNNLMKDLDAHIDTVHELEEASKTVMGELDALKYTTEVGEESHKEEVKEYQTALTNLSTELETMGDRFSALNRASAVERIQFELDSKAAYIQELQARLKEGCQGFAQACNERDHYRRVAEMDHTLANGVDNDVAFFQRQFALSEAKFGELKETLDSVYLHNARQSRLSHEALEAQKTRVEELEKELHELYQNLHAKASTTAEDAVTASNPAEDKGAAIEDLARQLWSRMRGLEFTLKALDKSIVEPGNERKQLRLACDKVLGLREDGEEDGEPEDRTSVDGTREGDMGSESEDKLDGAGAVDQEAEQQDADAVAQSIIDDACDQLGYATDDPRRVLGGMGTEEGTEEFEDAAGSDSSTEAVLSEEDSRGGLENPDELEVGSEDAARSATPESSRNVPSDGTESSNGNDDDARTITQADYNVAITTTPQHAPPSAGETTQDEDDADDSMNMTPGTWASRYAPPFIYGEPVEDDMF